ncbi:MAG TPA: ABC transporter substrate-binding protein [Thermoanaerobaculia bacterium]|nr:ABC transporter substrate-binding protein [Thermoanaerobaculia bacterium]
MRAHALFGCLAFSAFLHCAPETPIAPAVRYPTQDDRPRDGGTLVRRLDGDVRTLNPVLAYGTERYVAQYLFTPLIYLDRDQRPIPGAAQRWFVRDGGRVYRFVLDARARYADGAPVRARDVEFTLQKIVEAASRAQMAESFLYLDRTRTRVVDDRTIDVAFTRPLSTQLTRFAEVYVVPAHVYEHGNFQEDFNARAVGSGPYTLRTYEPGRQIVVERRADYWGDKPHIQTVIFRVIQDHETAWNALKLGDIDETFLRADTWRRAAQDRALTAHIRFERFPGHTYSYIAWNNRRPLFADPRVRRALSMCIPVDTVVQTLYSGTARRITGPFRDGDAARNPAIAPVAYNPVEGARILADAGWTDRDADGVLDDNHGTPFAFALEIFPNDRAFAELAQAELRRVGIAVELRIIDAAIPRIREGNFDAAYLGVDLDSDPDLFGTFHSSQKPPHGGNIVSYANPDVDRLIDEARTEFDVARRQHLHRQLHALLAADQPYTWIVQPDAKWALRRRVRGVQNSPGRGLFLWYPGEFDWWLTDAP